MRTTHCGLHITVGLSIVCVPYPFNITGNLILNYDYVGNELEDESNIKYLYPFGDKKPWFPIPEFLFEWTLFRWSTLQWCRNEYDGVSNHLPRGYLLKRLFRRRSKKKSKLRVTGLCFVRGIHRSPVNSPHKGPVTRKLSPFDDVVMKPEYFGQTRRISGPPMPSSLCRQVISSHGIGQVGCWIRVVHEKGLTVLRVDKRYKCKCVLCFLNQIQHTSG